MASRVLVRGVIGVASVVLACGSAFADAEVVRESTLSAEAAAKLIVLNPCGDVRVKADPKATEFSAVVRRTAKARTAAEAEAALELVKVTAKPDGPGAVAFKAEYPDRRAPQDTWVSVDWVITVPESAHIRVDASMGDVEVRGVSGGASIEASMGDVAVTGVAGGATIDASMGDVTVEVSGGTTVSASMGDVEVKLVGAAAPLTVSASMGDVHVTIPAAGWSRLEAATAMGQVSAPERTQDAAKWVVEDDKFLAVFSESGGHAARISDSMGDIVLKMTK